VFDPEVEDKAAGTAEGSNRMPGWLPNSPAFRRRRQLSLMWSAVQSKL